MAAVVSAVVMGGRFAALRGEDQGAAERKKEADVRQV
jgi:hypothetical protein